MPVHGEGGGGVAAWMVQVAAPCPARALPAAVEAAKRQNPPERPPRRASTLPGEGLYHVENDRQPAGGLSLQPLGNQGPEFLRL